VKGRERRRDEEPQIFCKNSFFKNSLTPAKESIAVSSYLLALIIAVIAGASMAFQGSLNAVLGKYVGLLETTLIVHVVGLIVIGILFTFQLGEGGLAQATSAPWYTYIGGALGVVIIFGVAAAIPMAGVAKATTAIIVTQLTMAMLIDHFGWFGLEVLPFNLYKGIGLIFLAIGGYLVLGAGAGN